MGNLYNSGKINNKGVELSLNYSPVSNFEFQLAYSYIHMEKPLFATPKSNLFISGLYHIGKFRFNCSLQEISDLNNDAAGKTNLISYGLLNAKAAFKICRYAELTLSGENLTGVKYAPNRYYPMPLSTIFAGVNLQFGKIQLM